MGSILPSATLPISLFGFLRLCIGLLASLGCSAELASTADAGTGANWQDAAEADSATPIEETGPHDATTVDASSDAAASDASECSACGPPCPSECETIRGAAVEDGCIDMAGSTGIACREIAIANGLVSCVVNEGSGAMYILPSDSYRQTLVERGGWKDCPAGWQDLLGCDDACENYEPPCPPACEAILGTPVVNGCFEPSQSVEIACRKPWGTNGLISCVINEATGETYELASSTYLFELLDRGGWESCPDTWGDIPYCL